MRGAGQVGVAGRLWHHVLVLDRRQSGVSVARHRALELDLGDLDEGRVEVGQRVLERRHRRLHERRVASHAARHGALRQVRLLQLHRHRARLLRVEALGRVGENEVEVEQILVGVVVAARGHGRRGVGHGAAWRRDTHATVGAGR